VAKDPRQAIVGALLFAMLPLAVYAATRHRAVEARSEELGRTVPQAERSNYVTSDRCKACHPSQYASWHRGYHRSMTQYASLESVKGDFDDVALEGEDNEAHLFKRGDDFMAVVVDPLWQYEVEFGQREAPPPGIAPPRVERRVSLVTGSHHMQAYWLPSNLGNGQLSLQFTYLLEDRRWVPRGEVFLHPPDQQNLEQVWNVSCITCHATGGQPRALVGGKAIKSRVGEMGIACESCHGPAEAHVRAQQNPVHRYSTHLRHEGDPTIVNPARLPAPSASQVCGQCHSLTDLSDEVYLGDGRRYVPGDDLEKTQPLLRPLMRTPALERHLKEDPTYFRNYFWADGTIRVSSRDYSGMIESKCMTSGKLSCGTCHSLHESDPDGLIAAGKDGDGACLECHAAIAAAIPAHTHHASESSGSRCYNCHMPHTVYGLLKAIRNHRIDSPRISGQSGGDARPNACNLCHLDRSLAWTAGQLEHWYGQPAHPELTEETPAAVVWLLSGDAVLRAVSAWHFGWAPAEKASPNADAAPYLAAALADPYSAVRYVAGHAIAKIDPESRFDYLAPPDARQHVADEIRRRWIAQDHAKPSNPSDPAVIDARIRRLIEARDETPVRAME
jgi:predicted CXXCH cytochrome family protein